MLAGEDDLAGLTVRVERVAPSPQRLEESLHPGSQLSDTAGGQVVALEHEKRHLQFLLHRVPEHLDLSTPQIAELEPLADDPVDAVLVHGFDEAREPSRITVEHARARQVVEHAPGDRLDRIDAFICQGGERLNPQHS